MCQRSQDLNGHLPTVQFVLIEPDENPGTIREFLDEAGEEFSISL
ncbi:hypothetical protein [Peribacillus simplex]|nr:hypothetical protein [Peribacillus simplex]